MLMNKLHIAASRCFRLQLQHAVTALNTILQT